MNCNKFNIPVIKFDSIGGNLSKTTNNYINNTTSVIGLTNILVKLVCRRINFKLFGIRISKLVYGSEKK